MGLEVRMDEVRKVIGVLNIVYIVEVFGFFWIWWRVKV